MPNILIAGGTGLIGQRLSQILTEKQHQVFHLSRHPKPSSKYPTYKWDIDKNYIDQEAITQADYVINLAGAGVADQRWTPQQKKRIIDSRVKSTRLLLSSFNRYDHSPKAYLASAAIGFYGDRGSEWLDERAGPSNGFLSESCQAWENAIKEVSDAGIPTLTLRIGIVLTKKGGALEKMLLPIRFYTNTYFGDGQQWYSWIHIDDLCQLFVQGIEQGWQGVYNGVAPNPSTNKDFAVALAKGMNRPALLFSTPAFILKTAMGEMAEILLNSSRVSAKKAMEKGFEFRFPTLEDALNDLLD